MKVAATVTHKKKQIIDVTFPLFLKSGDSFDFGGWYETFRRIEEDGTEYELTINDKDEWQFEKSHIDLADALGYYLVEKGNAEVITAQAFEAKVADFMKLLNEVPREPSP